MINNTNKIIYILIVSRNGIALLILILHTLEKKCYLSQSLCSCCWPIPVPHKKCVMLSGASTAVSGQIAKKKLLQILFLTYQLAFLLYSPCRKRRRSPIQVGNIPMLLNFNVHTKNWTYTVVPTPPLRMQHTFLYPIKLNAVYPQVAIITHIH